MHRLQAVAGRTIWLFIAIVLGSTGQLCGQSNPAAPAGKSSKRIVVARVNGAEITESALLDEMDSIYPSVMGHGGLSPEKVKQVRAKALDELIIQQLAYQEAIAQRTAASQTQVENEYQRLRAKYGAQRFANALRASGTTPAQYRADLKRRMTLQRVFEQRITAPARMSPAAVRAYYNQHRDKFRRPEQIHARLFLASVPRDAAPEQEQKASEKAQHVYRELQVGKDFGELAEKFSEDAYRVKGGDLGWVHRGRLDPQFEEVVFNLKVGEVSKPFRTPYGYNLMKLEAREEGRQMRFEEVKDSIKAQHENEKAQQLRRAFIAGLKKRATVEVLDTGIAGSEFTQNNTMVPVAAH